MNRVAIIMRTSSRFGTKPASLERDARFVDTSEGATVREASGGELEILVKQHIQTSINELKREIKSELNKAFQQKPNEISFGNKRLVNVGKAVRPGDVITLADLVYNRDYAKKVVDFGEYTLRTKSKPASANDLVSLSYLQKHYVLKTQAG